MAYKNELITETQNKFSYDELQEAFHELLDDLKKLRPKNKDLKLKNQILSKEKEEIFNKSKELKIKYQTLQRKRKKFQV